MQPLNKQPAVTVKPVFPDTHNGGGSCTGILDCCDAAARLLEMFKHWFSRVVAIAQAHSNWPEITGLHWSGVQLLSVLAVFGCAVADANPNVDNVRAVQIDAITIHAGQLQLAQSTTTESPRLAAETPEKGVSASAEVDTRHYTLTEIRIDRRDIFSAKDEASAVRHVYRAIDALHVTTREQTILREIDLRPGQRLSNTDVAELERNLRALGLFASVSARLVPLNDNSAELHINTRDRLSIVFGASGSFLGGIGELGFTVGERNVNGTGDRLLLSYSGTTDGQLRGAVAYDDIHFINNEHTAAYSAGRTEEGRFYHFQFARPFKTRASRLSWSVKAESVGSEIDYYENGVSVAQVPQQSESLIFEAYRRRSVDVSAADRFPRFFRYGTVLRFDQKRFEPTTGLQPDLVTAPLDNTRVFAGALLALNRNSRFEKARGIDAVRFTEDLSFGYSAEILAGFDRTEDSANISETNPAVFVEALYAFGSAQPAAMDVLPSARRLPAQTFGKVSFNGFSNLQSGDAQSWSAGLTLKLFNRALTSHTLAGRVSYITSDRGDELPTQFTLGENNGLRGYAARQFSGSNRLRINLEDRVFTGWRLGAFDIGALAFIDAGWAGDDTSQLSLKTSAGVGLRLGSNALLGADIIRLDVAYPFNPVNGESSLSVSLSLGQVFSF